MLDLRRLADPIARGELQADTPLAPYISPVALVQESTLLANLLPLIRSGQPLLVVVDEHGGTEGWSPWPTSPVKLLARMTTPRGGSRPPAVAGIVLVGGG